MTVTYLWRGIEIPVPAWPTSIDRQSKAWAQRLGFEAYEREVASGGIVTTACPFEKGTLHRSYWLLGFGGSNPNG